MNMRKIIIKKIFVAIVVVVSVLQTSAQIDKGNLLIKNATLITISQGNLSNTDLLVINGKIKEIGKNIATPKGVEVIDATGLYVMPGIIDAHSHIGLDAINEGTNAITPEVNTGDVINPFQLSIYRALAGGCTISHALHGSANSIGGQSQTIKHRYGVFNPLLLKMEGAPRTIKFALGENPTGHGRRDGLLPQSRMGVEFVIREAFNKAKEYNSKWEAYRKNMAIKGHREAPPAYSLRYEVLGDLLNGKIILHCHSYRADEINMMLKVCKDFGITKVVFQHVNEGFKVAPELKAAGAMASVFSDWWGYKLEVYYSTAYNAAILVRNGVVTSINSDSPDLIRYLYHEAAKTQKYGDLTDDEALSLITINPAKQLGIDHLVGTLEVGKDADIAIFKNHPLSIYAMPQYTIVDGIIRFNLAKDPADMRLMPDPKETIDVTVFDSSQDQCLQGVDLGTLLGEREY